MLVLSAFEDPFTGRWTARRWLWVTCLAGALPAARTTSTPGEVPDSLNAPETSNHSNVPIRWPSLCPLWHFMEVASASQPSHTHRLQKNAGNSTDTCQNWLLYVTQFSQEVDLVRDYIYCEMVRPTFCQLTSAVGWRALLSCTSLILHRAYNLVLVPGLQNMSD